MYDASLGQQAYDHIKKLICDGQIPMGQKMSEAQLAKDMAMSRTPVRIALARLEAEGFLSWQPNRGYNVTVFSIEDVRAIYGVRAMLESEAVRLCGRRGMKAVLTRELQSLTDAMGKIVSNPCDDPEGRSEFLRLNHRFHRLIYENCGNPFLLRQIAATADLPLALRNYFAFSPKQLAESQVAHEMVLTALMAREPDRAAGLMREHIWSARDRMSVRKTKRRRAAPAGQASSRGKVTLIPGKDRPKKEGEARHGTQTEPQRSPEI